MHNRYILLLMLLPASLAAQSLYFPPNNQNTWETLSPASLGYCPEQIDSLYQFLDINDSKAFILLKDGKIVLEKYFGAFQRDSFWYWASAGKTLTATLVGIAQQEGKLSVDDTTSTYLGKGWTSCTPPQEAKITIWNQLTMTTGLDDGVSNPDCTKPGCLQYQADAGTRWAYHNAPYTLLDSVLQQATGMPLNQFLASRLRNPIGMNGAYIKTGDNTVYYSNPRSMARFGLLLLAKGTWNGTPILADSVYVDQMINTSQPINPSYGYLTWLNGKARFMVPQSQFVFPGSLNPDAPDDMFAAMGKNGQVINVVPSEGLVWIRMGNPPSSETGLIPPVFNNEIWKYINQLACGAVSTAEVESEAGVRVFPNPFHDRLEIRSAEPVQSLTLFDVRGQLVGQWMPEGAAAVSWPLPGTLASGVYWLRVQLTDGALVVVRVVK